MRRLPQVQDIDRQILDLINRKAPASEMRELRYRRKMIVSADRARARRKRGA
jgi:hypothetical protein